MSTFLAALILGFTLSTPTFAEEVKVTFDRPFDLVRGLGLPTSFVVENPMGLVRIEPTDGGELILEGRTKSKKPIAVEFGTSSTGTYAIKVVYPETKTTTRRSWLGRIIDTTTVIDSVVINGEATESSVQPLDLRLLVPRDLLENLAVQSFAGRIEVVGEFASPLARSRDVDLKAGAGSIVCEDLCAYGTVEIENGAGAIEIKRMKVDHVRAKTATGRLVLDDVAGRTRSHLDVGAGSLELTRVCGGLKIDGGLTIDIAGCTGGPITVDSTTATVTMTDSTNDATIRTNVGGVTIRNHTNGHLDVRTQVGSIVLDNPSETVTETASSQLGSVRRSGRDGDPGCETTIMSDMFGKGFPFEGRPPFGEGNPFGDGFPFAGMKKKGWPFK